MPVDTSIDRMSAMNLLVPSYTGVFPVASPVTAGQRQAVAWVYSGIAAAAAAAAQNFTANLFKAIAERFTFRSSAIDGGFTFKAFTDVFTFGSVASGGDFDFKAFRDKFTHKTKD